MNKIILTTTKIKRKMCMEIIILLYFLALFAGLIILWMSGNYSVKYIEELAHIFEVSTFFLGFVFMSIATGLPELSIAINSSLKGVASLSAGNIFGSNFVNVALVLGLTAFFTKVIIVPKNEYKNLKLMFFITVSIMGTVFCLKSLTRIHGLLLIGLYAYCLFFLWQFRFSKKVTKIEKKSHDFLSIVIVFLKLLISIAFLILASEVCINSAVSIAKLFYVPLEIIGATIIALGTSLPELSVSLNAIKKKDYSLALSNVFGSDLENTTLLLGITAILSKHPVEISPLRPLIPFVFLAFTIAGYAVMRRRTINRVDGLLLLFLYLVFMIYQYFCIQDRIAF